MIREVSTSELHDVFRVADRYGRSVETSGNETNQPRRERRPMVGDGCAASLALCSARLVLARYSGGTRRMHDKFPELAGKLWAAPGCAWRSRCRMVPADAEPELPKSEAVEVQGCATRRRSLPSGRSGRGPQSGPEPRQLFVPAQPAAPTASAPRAAMRALSRWSQMRLFCRACRSVMRHCLGAVVEAEAGFEWESFWRTVGWCSEAAWFECDGVAVFVSAVGDASRADRCA